MAAEIAEIEYTLEVYGFPNLHAAQNAWGLVQAQNVFHAVGTCFSARVPSQTVVLVFLFSFSR